MERKNKLRAIVGEEGEEFKWGWATDVGWGAGGVVGIVENLKIDRAGPPWTAAAAAVGFHRAYVCVYYGGTSTRS